MKNFKCFGICFFIAVLSVVTAYGQEGFTGPGGRSSSRQVQTVTVAQAKNLSDDALVVLTGTIVQSLGDEKYTFRDSTGDITIEIDRRVWRGLSVGVSDTVEISGKMDIERNRVKVDVKTIKKV